MSKLFFQLVNFHHNFHPPKQFYIHQYHGNSYHRCLIQIQLDKRIQNHQISSDNVRSQCYPQHIRRSKRKNKKRNYELNDMRHLSIEHQMTLFPKHTSIHLLESSIRKPSPQVLTGPFGLTVGDTFPSFVEGATSRLRWIQRYDPIVFTHLSVHNSSISGLSHSLISKIEIGI